MVLCRSDRVVSASVHVLLRDVEVGVIRKVEELASNSIELLSDNANCFWMAMSKETMPSASVI